MNIPSDIKALFKQDSIQKIITLSFPNIPLTVNHSKIMGESMSITERLCSSTDLKFGACEADNFEIVVADVTQELKGQKLVVTMTIGGYDLPLGTYIVDQAEKQDNLRYKRIVARTAMTKADIDVASWYNGLSFPLTLASFRSSLLSYTGLVEETGNLPLPNDTMLIAKTITPSQISGRDVLSACEEINGVFGHINRSGKFAHVILNPAYGDYPTNDYPTNDYPISENDTSYVMPDIIDETITTNLIRQLRFEEYTVSEINKIIVRQEENDVGAIVGSGTNAYIIEGNFLAFGKSAAELAVIAQNAFGYIAKRPYRPYQSDNNGLPYLEVGSQNKFNTNDAVIGYMFNRTLSGIQSLKDEYIASGSAQRQYRNDVNKQIIQLQGRSTKIQTDVDGVRVDVSDLAEDTSANFTIAFNSIGLKVDANGIIAAINLSPEIAKIEAPNIALEGIVTANNNFKVLLDGSIEAVNGKFSGTITASTITGGSISGASFTQTGTSGTVTIANGLLTADAVTVLGLSVTQTLHVGSGITLSASTANISATNATINHLNTPEISGDGGTTKGTPVHSGNIANQTVANAGYATNSGHAVNADYATGSGTTYQLKSTAGSYATVSANDNFIPSMGGMYIGSSANYWAGAYLGSGAPVTSDRNMKHDINVLPDKFVMFAKKIIPRIFKYNDGTSNRLHIGFIAQEIEEAMQECDITDLEFGGLVKAPIYAKMLDDGDYDISSEIIGYRYFLRYEEFIPLLFALFSQI